MTLRKIYFGSVGPFLYDDTDIVGDVDGDFSGETQSGVVTDGPIKTTYTATADDEVVRFGDLPTAQTAQEILDLILTVDGSGSDLDADLLDGEHGSYYLNRTNHTGTQAASTISDFDTEVANNSTVAANAGDIDDLETWEATGVSGTFQSGDATPKTITVTNGLITSIV